MGALCGRHAAEQTIGTVISRDNAIDLQPNSDGMGVGTTRAEPPFSLLDGAVSRPHSEDSLGSFDASNFALDTTSSDANRVLYEDYALHPIPLIEDLKHIQYPLPLLERVYDVDEAGTTALMKAAASGDVNTVRYLLTVCGAYVDARDKRGLTAFWHAADKGHIAVIRCLAREYGASTNTRSYPEGFTALMKAANEGRLDVVRCLANDCWADVNAIDRNGRTALTKAAYEGRAGVVRCLARDCGANADNTTPKGSTALMKAAKEGCVNAVRCLAKDGGANVNATDPSGITALMKAASRGHADVVRCLVGDFSVDANATDLIGCTALMKAAREGHSDVVRYLAEVCGVDVNEKDNGGFSALTEAASHGHIEVVRYLARNFSIDMEATSNTGTPFMKAASNGHIDVVRFLATECAANLHATDRLGNTALILAASNGHLATVRCIAGTLTKTFSHKVIRTVRYDAKPRTAVNSTSNTAYRRLNMIIDQANKFGFTALSSAADEGRIDVVRCLAEEFAANVNLPSCDGTTPLMRAVTRGHIDLVRYLAGECKANVDATNEDGDTALMLAAGKGDVDAVRFLTKSCRADVNIKNRKGFNAIQGAADSGNQEVQRLLTSFIDVAQTVARASAVVNHASSDGTTEDNLHIPPSEIVLLDYVETISIGGDYKGKWLDADVAVKLFVPVASLHASFQDEVHLWHQLRHPNVIKMYGACDASPLPLQFFVCEYASNGSLLEYVKSISPVLQSVWSFLHQAALGLSYLHERGIVHGDLRCSNILIGCDGLSKLTNFSRNARLDKRERSSRAGLIRWQAPEVSEGKDLSFASDVYSLGMCIVEAVTKEMPWKDRCSDRYINVFRAHWTPETNYYSWGPICPPGDARNLVWRMCCKYPDNRVSLAFVVRKLEFLAAKRGLLHGITLVNNRRQESVITQQNPTLNLKCDKTEELWIKVQICMEKCDSELYRQAFGELKAIWERLQAASCSSMMFDQFYKILRDFRQIIAMSSEQARVLQLSATRTISSSIIAFRRRLRSLLTALGESADGIVKQDVKWAEQRSKQIEIFVSEASETYILLEELKSQDERLVFLSSLKAEIEHPSLEYTPGQLDVLKKAYEEIASKLDANDLTSLTPRWFLPWYELIIDEYDQLGAGGYGSVFKAKWLDSDVVVKLLSSSGDSGANPSISVSYDSLLQPSANPRSRMDMMTAFRREVDIWFSCSHPHVVRLFGACHVGRPLFVCEYASNGTLVEYLRKHPDELWSKLHEAALGIQYLHARNIVHGDLKGNNIVIGSDNKAKVTDFGLSLSAGDGVDPRISGASHWVAPECFIDENARPTYASDIYSFGMCIVEALRVVEAGEDGTKVCLPWGALNNFMAQYHAKQGKLPLRPLCTDDQWGLVHRMCGFEPSKRVKISTVVDELGRMATIHPSRASVAESLDPNSVSQLITAAHALLTQLHGDRSVFALYSSLWERLEQMLNQIEKLYKPTGLAEFYSIVEAADETTKKLQDRTTSLVSLAESVLRCYALQRRLDKLLEANFLSL